MAFHEIDSFSMKFRESSAGLVTVQSIDLLIQCCHSSYH